jgi:hypothetical protein
MSKNDNSIIEISPVAGEVLPVVRLGSGLSSLVDALNPLGIIGKAITEVLAYSVASKKLGVERERIRRQAEAIDAAIQSRLAYELKQFDLQREALLACLAHSENVLKERRASKQALIDSMNSISREMATLPQKRDISLDVYGMFRDALTIVSNSLVELEKAGTSEVVALSKELHMIVGDVRRELDGLPPINKLMPPSR